MTRLSFLNGVTVTDATAMICAAVRRDPTGYLDERVTPFATVRKLMGAPPPPRWRPIARRAWFTKLEARVACEIEQHEKFVCSLAAAGSSPAWPRRARRRLP